jgi:hypothetical protein
VVISHPVIHSFFDEYRLNLSKPPKPVNTKMPVLLFSSCQDCGGFLPPRGYRLPFATFNVVKTLFNHPTVGIL